MPLTLAEYDHQVGFHLRMIHHHSRMLFYHADTLTHQPAWAATAEDDLVKVDQDLEAALATVRKAREAYRSKPVDS